MFNRVPPLHLLVAFEAAARLGSFARAAEELSVTPSAVSHRIKNLEELWGEDLFVRSNAALRLTAAGTRYLRNVQDALKSLNELARPEYNKLRTRLRVAIPPTFGRQHLVPRLPEFGALYPHIDIELHLAIPFLDVKAEDSDVEIRYGTGRYPDLKTTRLLVEPVFPACGREYYERVNGRAITRPEHLHGLVLLRSPLEPWKPWFETAGLDWPEPQTGPQFNDIGLMLEAIASNQGVALVRQRMARHWLSLGQMVRLLDVESVSPHGYYIVEREHAPLKPEARYFVDWLLSLDW
ncbi:Glycine cleavage system transcriptional activator [Cupriavidus yeoncheonensis]|uniref:Glycine cleavage system transcriptional activator n=2 Tax=Cupriavidus yeoncheonensis TaxID=1462994 RepID=A0A916MTG5_9BURK|nr:Glycine cleavage system transcriptional activator [Cupriavidus yeoncheonensis]